MSTGQRCPDAAATIERQAGQVIELQRRLAVAFEERDQALIDLSQARQDLEQERRSTEEDRVACRAAIRERDEARAAASAVGISEIDRTVGDMIDSALKGGAKLVVEYCPGHGGEPEDFGCFVASLTAPDDELVRDAIGDTAMEAVRNLRPMSQPAPAPDERPF